jgi:glycosyltransferase involved in cell wall biosynthesis
LRIDVVCSSREVFGSDRSGLRLACALRDLGENPRLLVPAHRAERGLGALASAAGVAYEEASITIVTGSGIESPQSLVARRGEVPPDVTVYNSVAALRTPLEAPVRVQCVREWLEPSSPRHRVVTQLLRRRRQAVVAISSPLITQWRRCVAGPPQQHVVHNWLEDEWIKPDRLESGSHAPSRRGGIVCLGRFNAWKGQEVLADAFTRAFAGQAAPPSLRFIGAEPPSSRFHVRAAALRDRGVAGGWSVLPLTTHPGGYLRRAALLVLPSLRPEPFGNVILEALASGCRVIAFEGAGPSDLAPYFPGVLKLVERGVGPLSRGLAEWFLNGASGQSDAQHATTVATLRRHFTADRAKRDWAAVLSGLDHPRPTC